MTKYVALLALFVASLASAAAINVGDSVASVPNIAGNSAPGYLVTSGSITMASGITALYSVYGILDGGSSAYDFCIQVANGTGQTETTDAVYSLSLTSIGAGIDLAPVQVFRRNQAFGQFTDPTPNQQSGEFDADISATYFYGHASYSGSLGYLRFGFGSAGVAPGYASPIVVVRMAGAYTYDWGGYLNLQSAPATIADAYSFIRLRR